MTEPAETVDLDLDMLAAEADDQPKTVRVGGVTYRLPALLPLAVATYLKDGDIVSTARLLFGADSVDAVLPHVNERALKALTIRLYGVTEGE